MEEHPEHHKSDPSPVLLISRLIVRLLLLAAPIGWASGQLEQTSIRYATSSRQYSLALDWTGWRATSSRWQNPTLGWSMTTWANRDKPWQRIWANPNRVTLLPGLVYDWTKPPPPFSPRTTISASHFLVLVFAIFIFPFTFQGFPSWTIRKLKAAFPSFKKSNL